MLQPTSCRDAEGASTSGSRSYKSFSAFKAGEGPAGAAFEWHNIVEQTPGNIERFGAEQIHNTDNVIRLDYQTHREISAYYSSKQAFTGGQTVRGLLSTQSFEEQSQFGRDILQQYGG